ncbi:MAG: hypothetical protein MZU97_18650 [Bacillus subtilis]|nr:hypothetical protein [Bacillus subtilis]
MVPVTVGALTLPPTQIVSLVLLNVPGLPIEPGCNSTNCNRSRHTASYSKRSAPWPTLPPAPPPAQACS